MTAPKLRLDRVPELFRDRVDRAVRYALPEERARRAALVEATQREADRAVSSAILGGRHKAQEAEDAELNAWEHRMPEIEGHHVIARYHGTDVTITDAKGLATALAAAADYLEEHEEEERDTALVQRLLAALGVDRAAKDDPHSPEEAARLLLGLGPDDEGIETLDRVRELKTKAHAFDVLRADYEAAKAGKLPCGHTLTDLIGGTERTADGERPAVTKCGACLALRQDEIRRRNAAAAAALTEAHKKGQHVGRSAERERVVRAFDATLAGLVVDDDVRERVAAFARLLTSGEEPRT